MAGGIRTLGAPKNGRRSGPEGDTLKPLPVMFAQTTDAPADPAPGGEGKAPAPVGPLGNPMFLFVLMGVFFLVMVILPGRRQRKEQQQMMSSLKRGTKVATSSGLVGTIAVMKDGDEEIVLRSEDAKIRILKSSIVRVLGQDDAEPKS